MQKRWSSRMAGALALAAGLSASAAGASAEGPFAGLEGLWTGDGTIILSSGAQEPLRCRVQYNVVEAGSKLQQALRCASTSHRIEVNAEYTHASGGISGLWTETTLNVSGNVSGRARGDRIEAQVSGAFSANLELARSGNRQTVKVEPRSADVREVSVELRKGAG